MKNASEYARRVRRLLHGARGASGKPPSAREEEISGDLVIALLRRHVSDAAAAAAYRRLREATVDLNDLRVSPASDIAEWLGPQFPEAAAAGESIARSLASVFNRCHHLDLGFLKNMGRHQAREYIESLDGMNRFSAALFCLRTLGQHAVPLDERTLDALKQQNLVDPTATEVEAQGFLERSIPPGQVETLLAALRAPSVKKTRPATPKRREPGRSKTRARRSPAARREKNSARSRTPAKSRTRRALTRRR